MIRYAVSRVLTQFHVHVKSNRQMPATITVCFFLALKLWHFQYLIRPCGFWSELSAVPSSSSSSSSSSPRNYASDNATDATPCCDPPAILGDLQSVSTQPFVTLLIFISLRFVVLNYLNRASAGRMVILGKAPLLINKSSVLSIHLWAEGVLNCINIMFSRLAANPYAVWYANARQAVCRKYSLSLNVFSCGIGGLEFHWC